MPTFREKLVDPNRRLTTHMCTIPSAVVTQAMAAAGADAVMVDLEHGAVDYGSAHAMIAATAGTDCSPWVRVARTDAAQVKRALDIGAEGIVFPLIRTAEDAAYAVSTLHYPPEGVRSFGPFIAQSRWNTNMMNYGADMGGRIISCLLAETKEAVENIEAICAVPGIDIIVPAPFDLSSDLGVPGQFEHPDFVAAISRIEAACLAADIPMGGVALGKEQADALFARGYRLIAGFDILWLRARAEETQAWANG